MLSGKWAMITLAMIAWSSSQGASQDAAPGLSKAPRMASAGTPERLGMSDAQPARKKSAGKNAGPAEAGMEMPPKPEVAQVTLAAEAREAAAGEPRKVRVIPLYKAPMLDQR